MDLKDEILMLVLSYTDMILRAGGISAQDISPKIEAAAWKELNGKVDELVKKVEGSRIDNVKKNE